MSQSESVCFVQFLHPGGEHLPDAADAKGWNTGAHRRKFLLSPGKAIRKGQVVESDLVFWGEWEPQSELVAHFPNPANGEPEYLWRPFLALPTTYVGLQNTDPFVFGAFLYGICQQYRKTGPTSLRHLGRGSVILFGSSLQGHFVLDTVFVVKDWIDHNKNTLRDLLHGRVPEQYIDAVIRPLYESGRKKDACSDDEGRSWRLYRGATYDEPVDGMYSFFPCLPQIDGRRTFRRPSIDDERIVTSSARQGFRLNPQPRLADVVRLWQSVAERVQEQLWLGIHATPPEMRSVGR